MNTDTQIIELLGGTSAVARGINAPASTVSPWKEKGIPAWRLPAITSFADASGIDISKLLKKRDK